MSKNFALKLEASHAMITGSNGRTAREGVVQPGECPEFSKGEVLQTLELRSSFDSDLITAAFMLLHLSGGGCSYKEARWALALVRERLSSIKRRHYEACEEARRLGATDEMLRGMNTDRILARNEETKAARRAEFFSKMMATVRSVNVYEKAMQQAKLTTVGVKPDASKSEMEARYADLQALLVEVQRLATKPKAKEAKVKIVAA